MESQALEGGVDIDNSSLERRHREDRMSTNSSSDESHDGRRERLLEMLSCKSFLDILRDRNIWRLMGIYVVNVVLAGGVI